MQSSNSYKIITTLSFALAALVTFVSAFALATEDYYVKETVNWQAQSIGQDTFDLFIAVPSLIITTLLFRKSKVAKAVWGGIVLFLLYTFVIYCFDLHFTQLFMGYCFTLGLCFYSFLYYLYIMLKDEPAIAASYSVSKMTGIYFIIIACAFYFLWFSELLPATKNNKTPTSWLEVSLVTNPVQVIDIAVFLPGLFISGIALLQQKRVAFILTPSLLSFSIVMNLCIASLIFFMKQRQVTADYSISFIMCALALVSFFLLILYTKSSKTTMHPHKSLPVKEPMASL